MYATARNPSSSAVAELRLALANILEIVEARNSQGGGLKLNEAGLERVAVAKALLSTGHEEGVKLLGFVSPHEVRQLSVPGNSRMIRVAQEEDVDSNVAIYACETLPVAPSHQSATAAKDTSPPAFEQFLFVKVGHEAEIAWWWNDAVLHDSDYHYKVNDALNKKMLEVQKKFKVLNDNSFCCQFEGMRLTGDNPDQVAAAGRELAQTLARFQSVIPLS